MIKDEIVEIERQTKLIRKIRKEIEKEFKELENV